MTTKTALVTGASSGIGEATAGKLRALGSPFTAPHGASIASRTWPPSASAR